MEPLKWQNLKINKCPKCNKDTALKSPWIFNSPKTLEETNNPIMTHPCGFRISTSRFNEIIHGMVNDGLDKEKETYER